MTTATEPDEEVIWATSTTGDDFQCVHVDDWREARKRIAALELALGIIANFNSPDPAATSADEVVTLVAIARNALNS